MEKASLYSVRAKKLGVIMQGIRVAHHKDAVACAAVMGVPLVVYNAFESGAQSPSLPQLELLAFYLKIPLDAFWSTEIAKPEENKLETPNINALISLRNRVIGALLQKRRLDRGLSVAELAEKTGLSAEQIQLFEAGRAAVPLPVLEDLSEALAWTVASFQNDRGPVGNFFIQDRSMRAFKDLTPNLQKFVVQPVNRPYLELAQRLSEMDVNKLRNVAEGLLEITL